MNDKTTLLALLGRRPPVDLLLHPMTLGGLALMIFNDGWLRGAHPGWLTGKLSDVAAVLAYPGLLAALWSLGAMAVDRMVSRIAPGRGVDYSLRPAVLLAACAVTGTILAGINLSPAFRDGYLTFLGALDLFGWFCPLHYTMDPSDLLALLMLPGVWLTGRRLLARVPAGRLRTAYRLALRQAVADSGSGSGDAVRASVDRCLADVRRAQPTDQHDTLDALRNLLVESARSEATPGPDAPGAPGARNVAFDPAQHYHRLLQALETHRRRGSIP